MSGSAHPRDDAPPPLQEGDPGPTAFDAGKGGYAVVGANDDGGISDEWPEIDPTFLREELPPPPALPLVDVFGAVWADWITRAARSKSAPPDYVVAGLLVVAGTAIGNSRWASPWSGWREPPILWAMVVGSPSAGKSPGLEPVITALEAIQATQCAEAKLVIEEWKVKAELAKMAEALWKDEAKAAIKDGKNPPARPAAANPGPEPFAPTLKVVDGTIEKIALIVSRQPRGTLQFRDELSGWLAGMTRYSSGSDRPFWIESYGGRSHSVERIGRAPVHIDHLSVAVLGGIQPDRLNSLLLRADDDGLVSRFIPIWPDPAPIAGEPEVSADDTIEEALQRLGTLQMIVEEDGRTRPWYIPFSQAAKDELTEFRRQARGWEKDAEGLLLSFIGKTPGFIVRLSLILAHLDWAVADEAEAEPHEITVKHFGRAAHFIEAYALPMARRSYAAGSAPKGERAARLLLAVIRERRLEQFTTREVQRLDRSGLTAIADLNPALDCLTDAGVVHAVGVPPGRKGGRPSRLFVVNPAIWEG